MSEHPEPVRTMFQDPDDSLTKRVSLDPGDAASDCSEPTPLVPEPTEDIMIDSARAQSPWAWARAAQAAVEGAAPLLRKLGGGGKEPAKPAISIPRCPDLVSERPRPCGGDVDAPFVCGPCQLHMAVWLGDISRIKELLDNGADPNELDERGSTPLGLAVELYNRAPDYDSVMALLLESRSDPRARSSFGWSAIDEAVSMGNDAMVRRLYEHCQRNLRKRWHERMNIVVKSLEQLPDFCCTMRWEFESPLVPLLSKVAPSDVLRLWKQGSNLRLDSTLASWKKFRWNKRRNFTTLFNGADKELKQINHSKGCVVDATEELDPVEFAAVVDDLIKADPVQWDLKLDDLQVLEATDWLGRKEQAGNLNGWSTTRFDVRGSFDVNIKKKGTIRNGATFEDYFGCPLPADACPPELRAQFRQVAPKMPDPELETWDDASNADFDAEDSADLQRKAFGDFDVPDMEEPDDETISEQEVSEKEFRLGALPPCPEESTATSEFGCSEISLSREGTSKSAMQKRTFLRPIKSMGDLGPAPCPASQMQYAPSGASPDQVGTENSDSPGSSKDGSRPHLGGGPDMKARKSPGSRLTPGSRLAETKAKGTNARPVAPDAHGKVTHRMAGSIWVASDFAIPMRQFLPVLEALSVEHEALRKMKEFLGSRSLEEALAAKAASCPKGSHGHMFPVKVSMPMNLAVRAVVVFDDFELQAPGGIPPVLFEVPKEYVTVPRRDAQKTMGRRKKRMLLAHLAL